MRINFRGLLIAFTLFLLTTAGISSYTLSLNSKTNVKLNRGVLSDSTSSSPTPTTYCTPPASGCGNYYYWNTSSCTCEPQSGTCVPPYNGCPAGYTFNTSTCECVQSSGCTQPSGGCPNGYYWNTSLCSCTQQTTSTCPSPASGCGTGNYWDTSTCKCKSYSTPTPTTYQTTCVSPSAGCGTDKYWDSSRCECRSFTSGSTSCVSPSAGCGTNYYWDFSTCSCRYSGTTTCVSPSAGCGTNYYWSSESCSCKPYTTSCVSPTYGCGTGYTWDSSSCYCKPKTALAASPAPTTSVCTAPATGCGDKYYWDGSLCTCRPKDTTSLCSAPATGCGTGWYWDQGMCACKSSYDSEAFYSTTTTSYQTTTTQSMDRLAYEPPERIVCIKSILSDSEYQKLRYYLPQNTSDFDAITKLGEKVKSCWGVQTAAAVNGSSNTLATPINSEQCLLTSLGSSSYQEIYKGIRIPTYEEHLIFEKCNGNLKADSVTLITKKQDVPQVADKCSKDVLGGDLYDKVKKGLAEVPVDKRTKIDECFGADPQPFAEGRNYKIPASIKSCLLKAVGQSRFNEINEGRSDPNSSERKKADECFNDLNQIQNNFLPPAPERMQFAEKDEKTINLAEVKQNKKVETSKVLGGEIVLKGRGPKNSLIYLYIFSEPIVVTTKTDENGDWIYEMRQPLSGEKHIAYAAAKNTSGKLVRSSVFDFNVIAAEDDLRARFVDEAVATKPAGSKFLLYAFLVSLCGITAVGFLYYFYFRKNLALVKDSSSDIQGKSEGEI